MQFAAQQAGKQVVTWSDASGVDRWIAVVLKVEGRFPWARSQASQSLVDKFLPRDDNYIGLLELVAPLLAWAFTMSSNKISGLPSSATKGWSTTF